MALITFLVGTFGAPIYFGFVGDPILAPVLLAIAIAAFAVATGWRAGQRGPVASALIGVIFSLVVSVPLFFIGAWAGGKL
jgi:hypothetical protein